MFVSVPHSFLLLWSLIHPLLLQMNLVPICLLWDLRKRIRSMLQLILWSTYIFGREIAEPKNVLEPPRSPLKTTSSQLPHVVGFSKPLLFPLVGIDGTGFIATSMPKTDVTTVGGNFIGFSLFFIGIGCCATFKFCSVIFNAEKVSTCGYLHPVCRPASYCQTLVAEKGLKGHQISWRHWNNIWSTQPRSLRSATVSGLLKTLTSPQKFLGDSEEN